MIDNYLENVNTLDQQVEINKKDIENLKAYIQEAYKCNIPLDPEPQSISLNNTNAPTGTDKGWLIDTQGNLFKIVGSETIGTTLLVIVYYTNIKGPKGDEGTAGTAGVSIVGVEEISDEVVGTQTLTTIRIYYSNGDSDDIIVYAENGSGNQIIELENLTRTELLDNIRTYKPKYFDFKVDNLNQLYVTNSPTIKIDLTDISNPVYSIENTTRYISAGNNLYERFIQCGINSASEIVSYISINSYSEIVQIKTSTSIILESRITYASNLITIRPQINTVLNSSYRYSVKLYI